MSGYILCQVKRAKVPYYIENTRRERYSMDLPGLPERPAKATRLRLHLEFESANRCRIEAEDLGFGEMYPATGMIWKETMIG